MCMFDFLPQVPRSCLPPLKCSVSTTVHRRVFLQDGDTLEVILQAPPDYTPPTSSEYVPQPTPTQPTPAPVTTTPVATTTTTTATLTTTTELSTNETFTEDAASASTAQQQEHELSLLKTPDQDEAEATSPAPSKHLQEAGEEQGPFEPQELHQEEKGPATQLHSELVKNQTHLFAREDSHPTGLSTSAASGRTKRQVVGGAPHYPQFSTSTKKPPSFKETSEKDESDTKALAEKSRRLENQTANSPLTIWRVSVAEWASCSTREGGQIGEGGESGVVTVDSRFLQAGTNYFIGRSSWSSTECFKLQVMVRSAECGEGQICSGKGACFTNASMEHYQCRCCETYTGSHCEELDACESNPCLNSGICVDIQEGHDGDTFQCLCPYGYRGRYCEERTNLCESRPCQNGGTCAGNHSSYTCLCSPGWTGTQCSEREEVTELSSDNDEACANSPCIHGVCVETQSQGVRCFCLPGYGGSRCQFEYNECESSPCINGGTCVDIVGGFQCLCGRGYTGKRCQVKFDLCKPDPCPATKVCVDKGNSYSCECLNGLSEDNCGHHNLVCMPNPCENGGTCWIVPEVHVFFCSCRPGFTGRTCQGIAPDVHDEAVLETVGAVGTAEPRGILDVRMPVDRPLNHMKNIYVAFTTLAAALLIFIVVVGACHCRVNRTYRKCFVKLPRPGKVLHTVRRPRPTSLFDKASRRERNGALRLETDPDGAAMPMTSCNSNSDAVYYNMDACDNQELPLIK
ncbi:delta and Notch-like epidermal growth factor-related receptor [Penaeus japonicus]|uniref:delta and Notch-like epidermal growth factor-related receptor n=1 Tax=Penaeus japonicus TaxID=27405 RepID=UPI001C712ABA|nr:delta and Notch-like epidermal growth factor-related receptor [Penaeus japonicus]